MQQPLVSIIIPCYNAERWVSEAVQSSLDQTYSHREVIVIDDGSTDNSLEVIRGFGDRIRYESGPNRGACAARNCGLTLARGELIQFLDADDLLHSHKLEQQVPLMLSEAADIVYCNCEVRAAGLSTTLRMFSPTLDAVDPVIFTLTKIIGTPGPLHWKSRLEAIGGFRENLCCAQDYDLHLRLACAGATFYHLPEVLVTVRRQRGSLSSDSIRVLDQWSEIYWHAYRLLEKTGGLTGQRAATFAARMANDGRWYLRYGLKEKALDRFEQARRMHPRGGIEGAYGRVTRVMRRLFGPVLTERLIVLTRQKFLSADLA